MTAGSISHDGVTVSSINRAVGYMTQVDSVLPWRTVFENVELPLKFRGVPTAERRRLVEAMLARVNLTGFESSFPVELSGGMRKRVALAQVLVYDPGTLLMDEPFGALDAQLKLMMQAELLSIWQVTGKSVVFVTHDLAEAVTLASRVVVFSGRPGQIKRSRTCRWPIRAIRSRSVSCPSLKQSTPSFGPPLPPRLPRGKRSDGRAGG